MSLLPRIRYALFLAIAITMVAWLAIVIASADAIALLPPSAFDFAFGPGVFLLSYAVSFIIAPYLMDRFPIKRDWQ